MNLNVKGIVCHLSASRWGDAEEITKWHIARGFNTIGYHGVILNGYRDYGSKYVPELDGKIEPGRPENKVGAHCLAEHMNEVTLGVCMVGMPGWKPEGAGVSGHTAMASNLAYATDRQIAALIHWLAKNCAQYGLDPLGTFSHKGMNQHVISQHSDHDRGKPLCCSQDMKKIRQMTYDKMVIEGWLKPDSVPIANKTKKTTK